MGREKERTRLKLYRETKSDAVEVLGVGAQACPHCGHHHPSAESVTICGLQRRGYRWIDADGYMANGPYTRPDLGGPRKPVRLLRASCSTCLHVRVTRHGAMVCSAPPCQDAEGLNVDLLDALGGPCEHREHWRSRTPPGRVSLKQIELFYE